MWIKKTIPTLWDEEQNEIRVYFFKTERPVQVLDGQINLGSWLETSTWNIDVCLVQCFSWQ